MKLLRPTVDARAHAGQNSRAASALRYCVVRGSSGPSVSNRSTNSWRACSSSFTRSSSPSSSASTALCRHLDLLLRQPRLGGELAGLGRFGYPGEQLQRLCRLAACIEQTRQAHERCGVVGLELESAPKRCLVARRRELVRL